MIVKTERSIFLNVSAILLLYRTPLKKTKNRRTTLQTVHTILADNKINASRYI